MSLCRVAISVRRMEGFRPQYTSAIHSDIILILIVTQTVQ